MITTKNSPNVPAAIGPYSHVAFDEHYFFTSGQIPILNNEVILDIKIATKLVLDRIKILLHENNLEFKDIIKTTIYMIEPEQFNDMNEIYSQYFNLHKPARSCVFVKALPKNSPIEIEIIAKKSI